MQPKSDPTRPLIVSQEYLIFNDDMSLHATMPEKVENTLPQLKPLLSKQLQEYIENYDKIEKQKEETYYELINNEGLDTNTTFGLIGDYELATQTIKKNKIESTRIEHTSSTIRNTLDNFMTSQENPTINW